MRFDSRGLVSTYLSQWMPTGDTTRQGVAGYFGGGDASAGYVATIDRISFATDTKTVPASLAGINDGSMTSANSGVAGYWAGGFDTGYLNLIQRLTFPAEVRTTLSPVLTATVYLGSGFSNSGVAGYFAGGYDGAISGVISTVDKLAFPAETKSTSTSLIRAGYVSASFSNVGIAGYICGGNNGTVFDTVSKYVFPVDTISDIGNTLTVANNRFAGFANYGVAGYCANGYTSSATNLNALDKFALPADTRTSLGAVLSVATRANGAMNNTGVAGYVGGGNAPRTARVDKISFPSDTVSFLGSVLSQAMFNCAGCSDEGVF